VPTVRGCRGVRVRWLVTAGLVVALIPAGCGRPAAGERRGSGTAPSAESDAMSALAARYVRLVLDLGQHDADYVDAYYGPPEWRVEAEQAKRLLVDIDRDAADVLASLGTLTPLPGAGELVQLRHRYLTEQLGALRARVAMLQGKRFGFDEESEALYDAVAPEHPDAEFAAVLQDLDVGIVEATVDEPELLRRPALAQPVGDLEERLALLRRLEDEGGRLENRNFERAFGQFRLVAVRHHQAFRMECLLQPDEGLGVTVAFWHFRTRASRPP